MNRWVIQFDGAAWNNGRKDSRTAAAAVAFLNGQQEDERLLYLGAGTNNTAEFTGLCLALELMEELHQFERATGGGQYSFLILGDSKLAVNGFNDKFNIKAAQLVPLLEKAKQIAQRIGFHPTVQWCPREANGAADAAATRAIREHIRTEGQPAV